MRKRSKTTKTTQKETPKQAAFQQEFQPICIEEGALWGQQTQRSLKYFNIGNQLFDPCFINVLVTIKRYAAEVNHSLNLISKIQKEAIVSACQEILQGEHSDQFPLHIWQTGSGTQTNMNVNEVICTLANIYLQKQTAPMEQDPIHPNDHINLSQSSNDIFPSAMHIVVVEQTQQRLLPALKNLEKTLLVKHAEFEGVYSVGRTHLMDALPIKANSILSAYHSQILSAKNAILESLGDIHKLALGGTAVGSGANAPSQFGQTLISLLAKHYKIPFIQHPNLYAAVSGEDALLRHCAAQKQLAAALLKIANDIRLLGSGPRCGLNEWRLPANEPGSSIMPGKVNPTQCEALSMVCLQIFGNELSVSLASSNGQLQLNTYRPLIIHNILENINLLTDSINSFSKNCIEDLKLNTNQLEDNINKNLSVITLLVPKLGYDKATLIAHTAEREKISLATAAELLGLFSHNQFETLLQEYINLDLSDP